MSEQVARLLAEYVQQEIDPDGPGLYYWCELCDGDGPLKETVDHKDDCPIGALEASQQENERLQELIPDNGQVRCPGCGHDFLIAASRKREEQVKTPDEDPTEIMDFPTSRVTPEYMQHASHCNQGEYEGVCKYGDSDCPILTEQEAQEWDPDYQMGELGD